MDFALSPELVKLKDDVDSFVRQDVIPYEDDPRWTEHGPTDELRRELNAKDDLDLIRTVRAAGYALDFISELQGAVAE